jgi:hypothetical protein
VGDADATPWVGTGRWEVIGAGVTHASASAAQGLIAARAELAVRLPSHRRTRRPSASHRPRALFLNAKAVFPRTGDASADRWLSLTDSPQARRCGLRSSRRGPITRES